MNESTRQKKTQEAVTTGGSALRRYQDTIVGQRSFLSLLHFEWCMLVGALPGALGLFMRKIFWPRLFRQCGAGTVFGARVIVRCPNRIVLGQQVVVSDGAVLDARCESGVGIEIGSKCILSNNVMISCKKGEVRIGENTGIGAQTIIHAVNDCRVEIGNDVMIGAMCYLAGGGNYNTDRTDIPMNRQGLKDESGISIGDDVWLGARVTVLPEVQLGKGCIVAAGAVVTKSAAERQVLIGVPAKITASRAPEEQGFV